MTLACTGIGIGASRGIALGEAHLLRHGHPELTARSIAPADLPAEIVRFLAAVDRAKEHFHRVKSEIPEDTRSEIVAFIDAHLLMLDDDALVKAPIRLMEQHHYAAEWALQVQRDALVDVFDAMEDPYLRTRKDDVDHVVNQILHQLLNREHDLGDLEGKVIVSQDLMPADAILMRQKGIAAFVTEFGGPMSHTAILARSLGIPAVVGVRQATRCFRQGEALIVDSQNGVVLAEAGPEIIEHYRQRMDDAQHRAGELKRLIGKRTVTRDGLDIRLMANIELPEDIDTTRQMGADGVGLYRTEFLYMNRGAEPDEEEHYAAYRQVLEGLGGMPVTIRTLDLGADKQVESSYVVETPVCNPALGLRAIRLCLKEPKLFRPQLRAILRASAEGPVRIMIPMLTNLHEVRVLKQMVEETKTSLASDNIPFDPAISVGGMIEVPAAALSADAFARELDFLSIGTNDLVQYTLAIDRVDDEVNYLYDPLHPSVLRLILMVIDAGERQGIPVSMCGEMAGDPRFTPLLLGMGLREFSMQPGSLLEVKRTLRSSDVGRLRKTMRKIIPELEAGVTSARLEKICSGKMLH